ncbi:MAG: ABC transporter ATP-binding protein, partial [Lachnospiraceae bacterium]|nr:ABC transporter ATP-binding protein [Lachnospiraceae bacterium]
IAMALLGEPDLLIADEPVSALDVAIQESIMALLKKISTERGMAILFISHDLRTVYFMCHNVIVLKDGRIVESATKREIFEHPKAEYTKELLRSALGEEEI